MALFYNFSANLTSALNVASVVYRCAVLLFLALLSQVMANHAQAESPKEVIDVYRVEGRVQIGTVPVSAKYRVISNQGIYDLVQFVEPTVLGWVSDSFVSEEPTTNTATVIADVLNFRVNPSISSLRLTQVYRNHSSTIFERKNGFVKIVAPASLRVLIDSTGNQFDSKWVRGDTKLRPTPAFGIDNSADVAGTAVETNDIVQPKLDVEKKAGFADSVSLNANSEQTHLLAPGDSVSLLVFGEPDLSAENVKVPQNGRVSFPLIGSVKVLGKTTLEVEQEVAALLSQGYVRNPRLTVSIFSYRPIFIRGEVRSSGSFPYAAGLTIAKAIALAGGVTDSAKADGISITRDGTIISQNLSVNSQVRIASGDIVSAEADLDVKQADSSYVFLHGEVAQSGAYEFKKGLTVEKAVVLAGGFTLRASKKKISISRYENLSDDGAPVEMRRVKLYEQVRPGDVIKVGASWF